MTTSIYAKRPPFIDELAILSNFLYAIIAAINYLHVTYMIHNTSVKIKLTINFTKRTPRHNEFAIRDKLINMVSVKVSYVYITKYIDINTT
jgi:hypothetical protein